MTVSPKVSIVIPCFNREKSVTRAVQSVLDQSISDIEVIAVDDASVDGTLERLRQIHDPRLRVVVSQLRSGAAAARNYGTSFASAPWIAFQDSDDFWHPNKLEAQLSAAEETRYIASFCKMNVYQGSDKIAQVPPQGFDANQDIRNAILQDSIVSTQTLIIRRNIYREIGGMDPRFRSLDDWDLAIRLAHHGPVQFMGEVLVDQHISHNSMTHDTGKQLEAQIRILEKHRTLLDQQPSIKAVHLNRLAGAYRKSRNYSPAARHASEAVRLRPWNIKLLGQALLCNSALAIAPVFGIADR